VFHAQYMQPGFLPIVAARWAQVPTVLATVHHMPTSRRAILLLRTAQALGDGMSFVSRAAHAAWSGADRAVEPVTGRRNGGVVIPNPVDVSAVDRALEAGPELRPAPRSSISVIGTVARLVPLKGVDVLLEAFVRSRSRASTELWIVGDGDAGPALRRQAHDLGVADRVRWFGSVSWEHAVRLLSAMDVVVVPSRTEGFGLVAAEAMACRRPVIASNVGGLPEVVADGVTGRLVPPDDPSALARAIDEFVAAPDLCRNLGQEGRRRVEACFGVERYRRELAAFYDAAQRRRQPGRSGGLVRWRGRR